jgi:hypothetical protein
MRLTHSRIKDLRPLHLKRSPKNPVDKASLSMHDIDFRSAGKAHLISNLKSFSSGRSYESPSHKPTPLASHVADLRTARHASHHLLKPQETKTQHIPNELSKTNVRSLPNQLDARTCESNSPSITKVRFSGKVRRRSYFDFDEDKTSPRGPLPLWYGLASKWEGKDCLRLGSSREVQEGIGNQTRAQRVLSTKERRGE